jgi:hypothetical protein
MNWKRKNRLVKALGLEELRKSIDRLRSDTMSRRELYDKLDRLEWMIIHPPKFKVGDKVISKHAPPNQISTVTDIDFGLRGVRGELYHDYVLLRGDKLYHYPSPNLEENFKKVD